MIEKSIEKHDRYWAKWGFGFFSVEFRKPIISPLKKKTPSFQSKMMTSFCFNYFWQMIFKNWQLKNYSILLPDFPFINR